MMSRGWNMAVDWAWIVKVSWPNTGEEERQVRILHRDRQRRREDARLGEGLRCRVPVAGQNLVVVVMVRQELDNGAVQGAFANGRVRRADRIPHQILAGGVLGVFDAVDELADAGEGGRIDRALELGLDGVDVADVHRQGEHGHHDDHQEGGEHDDIAAPLSPPRAASDRCRLEAEIVRHDFPFRGGNNARSPLTCEVEP